MLKKYGIDVWLTFSREGSDLLLPYVMGGEYLVGQAALMVFAQAGRALRLWPITIRVRFAVNSTSSTATVATGRFPFLETMRERNPARIAVNYSEADFGTDGLTYGLYLKLTRTLAEIGMADRIESSEPVTALLRAIKTPSEIERIRRACAITQQIFDHERHRLGSSGLTEMQVHEFHE